MSVDRAGNSSVSVDLAGRGRFGWIERGSLGIAVEGVGSSVGRLDRGSGIGKVVVVGFDLGGSSLGVVGGSFVVVADLDIGIGIGIGIVDLDTVIVVVVGLASSGFGLDLFARVVRSRPCFVGVVDAAANSDFDPVDSVQVRIQAVVLEQVHDDRQRVHKHYGHNT